MKGIKFGTYHTYDDFNMILSEKKIGSPSPKIETVDVPGGDGVLDLTDYFGGVKYGNRSLSFDFSTITSQDEFMNLFSRVQNALHGQKMKIVLDEDPDWYYIGRITVSEWKAEKNIGKLTIDCDCDPYKYKKDETVVLKTVSGSAIFNLLNNRKKVVPTIIATAAMTYSWGNNSRAVSAGTFRIPELELIEGNNVVTVTGTGTVTFRYQEGGL